MKDIPGYEGRYAITKQGEIWSYANSRHQGKWLTFNKTNGFYSVKFFKDTRFKTHYVHRLVAATYLDYVPKKHIIHKDMNPFNNNVENLIYGK